jgi:hypothetical protein
VFEIPYIGGSYASTPTTLFNFNGTNGANPRAGLTADAAGDLFGTANDGPYFLTVFEIAKTSTGYASTPTILASFYGASGETTEGGLVADAAGDLFGTTYVGGLVGPYGSGTVFELVNNGGGSYTPTTLASFNFTDAYPEAGLIADAAGDLFSATGAKSVKAPS